MVFWLAVIKKIIITLICWTSDQYHFIYYNNRSPNKMSILGTDERH